MWKSQNSKLSTRSILYPQGSHKINIQSASRQIAEKIYIHNASANISGRSERDADLNLSHDDILSVKITGLKIVLFQSGTLTALLMSPINLRPDEVNQNGQTKSRYYATRRAFFAPCGSTDGET